MTLWNENLGGAFHKGFKATRFVGNKSMSSVRLYAGIIDILQEYSLTKKLEVAYKGLKSHPDAVSATDPTSYSERFLSFMDEFVFR